MDQSFIELPSLNDVKDLSRSVQKKVNQYRPEVTAPVGHIFSAQCINYFVPYSLAFLLFAMALGAVPSLSVDKIFLAGPTFWIGSGLLVSALYFTLRFLFWVYLGTSLGEYCLGISTQQNQKLPKEAIVWESLHFICPALWILELSCRLLSFRVGVSYFISYKK